MIHLVINSRMKNIFLSESTDSPYDALAHDYAFLLQLARNPNMFADESKHKQFVTKHSQMKKAVLTKFAGDYYNTFKQYQTLRKSDPVTRALAISKQRQKKKAVQHSTGGSLNASKVNEMAYQKPNFEQVWNKVSNNAFVSGLGLEKWIELAQSGKDSKISKPSMDKVLDYDPTIKAKDDLKYSSVNMPIILKSPMGDYHLLTGNAELNGIMDMHGNAKVWFVDGSQAAV